MYRVWIYGSSERAAKVLRKLAVLLGEQGFEVRFHPSTPIDRSATLEPHAAREWADVAIVVGGDGTLLRAFHEVGGSIPVLGVNSGGIGYLMDAKPEQLEEVVDALARGDYWIEERMTGLALIEGRKVEFLNEIVVTAHEREGLVDMVLKVDDEPLLQGRADGLIVATPTGSTAYALSAGGPLVDPLVNAFVVVPLAPFSVLLKTAVLSPSRRISIEAEGRCRLIVDGVESFEVEPCRVEVKEVKGGFKLVRLKIGESWGERLRRRLLDLRLSSREGL